MNLRIIFETILERMPDIRLAGEPRRLRSNFVNGYKEIPVSFTPSAPSEVDGAHHSGRGGSRR
ncbi:hypothetical protein ACFQY7_52680 [Actinomadura luteofluorescens]|uniref:hypothetical protein n=1 Tax=Actinomadura luteofluorescens TaxID=46163 RepID=UPI003641934C